MALSIAGMFVGNCTVTDPDSVDVSYPTFIQDMKKIGANLTVAD
jgi:3-phosphoshikimate 1-carboxyvinyltransferase